MTPEGKPQLIGASVLCLIGTALLGVALWGSPPYAYYGIMKWLVAGSACYSAYTGFSASKGFAPISLLLLGSAGTHLFSKMRKADWAVFNLGGMLIFVLAATVLAIMASKSKPT